MMHDEFEQVYDERFTTKHGFFRASVSNVSRGKRDKSRKDGLVPCILHSQESAKGYRKNRARLIQKIGACPGLDPGKWTPFACPRCKGEMPIIAFIEKQELIKKILKHLGLWEVKPRPPPKATRPPKMAEYSIDYSLSQLSVSAEPFPS